MQKVWNYCPTFLPDEVICVTRHLVASAQQLRQLGDIGDQWTSRKSVLVVTLQFG